MKGKLQYRQRINQKTALLVSGGTLMVLALITALIINLNSNKDLEAAPLIKINTTDSGKFKY